MLTTCLLSTYQIVRTIYLIDFTKFVLIRKGETVDVPIFIFPGYYLFEFKVPARSFPVRHLVDACVVRMFIFLSLNEDSALIR